jgi:hypothetical protein
LGQLWLGKVNNPLLNLRNHIEGNHAVCLC